MAFKCMGPKMETLQEVLEEGEEESWPGSDASPDSQSLSLVSESISAVMDSVESTSNATCRQFDEKLLCPEMSDEQVQIQLYPALRTPNPIKQIAKVLMKSVQTNIENSIAGNKKTKEVQTLHKYPPVVTEVKAPPPEPVKIVLPKRTPGAQAAISREIKIWNFDDFIMCDKTNQAKLPHSRYKRNKLIQTFTRPAKKGRHYVDKGIGTCMMVSTKDQCTATKTDKCTEMFKEPCLTYFHQLTKFPQNETQTESIVGYANTLVDNRMSDIYDAVNKGTIPPKVIASRLSVFSLRLKNAESDLTSVLTNMREFTTKNYQKPLTYRSTAMRSRQSSSFCPTPPTRPSQSGYSRISKPPFRRSSRTPTRNYLGAKWTNRTNNSQVQSAQVSTSTLNIPPYYHNVHYEQNPMHCHAYTYSAMPYMHVMYPPP